MSLVAREERGREGIKNHTHDEFRMSAGIDIGCAINGTRLMNSDTVFLIFHGLDKKIPMHV